MPPAESLSGLSRLRDVLLRGWRRLRAATDKRCAELEFQRVWAREFRSGDTKSKVLVYWRTYRFLDDIVAACRIRDETRVLDIGCGISTVLHYIPGVRCGIDPLADEYRRLYNYPPDLTIQKGVGEAVPFPDESFDVVFCSNVLDHVTSPRKTVENIYRVLKPGGHFVLIVEVFEKMQRRDRAHPHSLTRTDIQMLLSDRFRTVFERMSPWVGARAYVKGEREGTLAQLVAVLEKR